MDIKVEFINDLLKAKQHYAVQAAHAYHGWFQDRRFLVLPELKPGFFNTLILPRTQWILKAEIREQFDQLGENFDWKKILALPLNTEEVDIDETLLLQIEDAEQLWSEVEDYIQKVTNLWTNFFDLPYRKLLVELLPINFGTGATFYLFQEGDTLRMHITPRSDVSTSRIIRSFIQNLVIYHHKHHWEHDLHLRLSRQRIGDFLFAHNRVTQKLALADIPLVEELFQDHFMPLELKTDSTHYLQELNLPLGTETDYDWELIKTKLSQAEFKLAQGLFNRKGQVVTYDQLSQLLYGQDWEEKFSLEYLAKLIQTIRKKLDSLGYKSVIFTQRGTGYGWF